MGTDYRRTSGCTLHIVNIPAVAFNTICPTNQVKIGNDYMYIDSED
jgi:hypothetical protein